MEGSIMEYFPPFSSTEDPKSGFTNRMKFGIQHRPSYHKEEKNMKHI
jgi:hypothetical protein